jgi:hypothetical protein
MYRTLVFLSLLFILSSCNPFAIAERNTVPDGIPASGSRPIEVFEGCPVTQPPQPAFIPQTGFVPEEGQFWFGSDMLWVELPTNGTWNALPQSEQGFTQKIFWWSKEYTQHAEPQPHLTVTGRRLDGKAPALVISEPASGSTDQGAFMLVGVTFPVEGCWQITGNYEDETLSFTVLVKQ